MKPLEKLKHEFLLVLPPVIFFFFAFLLLAITQRLVQRQYGIPLSGFGGAVIGALLVGKVVLIVDSLPFMNKFPGKPLLYNIAWKSGIYFLAAFLVRYIEHIFPLLREYGGVAEAPPIPDEESRMAAFLDHPDVACGFVFPLLFA
jgi:hypothetical protein